MSKNLAILGDYSARMAAGDYSAVYEVFAPDFMSHVTPRVSPEAVGTDIRPQEQKFWESARASFSDMKFSVDLLIESDDLVVSNWTVRGTHTGEIAGIGPTGKDVTVSGLTISRFAGGKIVEQWTTWDTLGMLVQLGVVPSSAASEVH